MDADITIIGAGVIGLAIASELAHRGLDLFVLERNKTHGMGISSRNSEVIHAGIYYPPESLKAKLCVEGRGLLYETCSKNGIPFKRTGKLIIATTTNEMYRIEHLWHNALQSGVTSVSLVEEKQIRKMEPNIRAIGGLESPETGILNVHSLMDYYLHNARMNGADIVYQTKVEGIEPVEGGYKISTINGEGELFEFMTERIINSAGLHSDEISRMVGIDYRLHYCKGDYFSIDDAFKGLVQRLIYPIPEENNTGLGVHLTLDINGRMKLGPDATYIKREEDYRVNKAKRDEFYESAVRFLPFIRKEDIVPDMSGIRPKLQGKGEISHDFVISEDKPGFINLIGIESPGLTAAPAIARYVDALLNNSA